MIGGFIGGIISGIDGVEIEKKTYTNQGIWRSITNCIILSCTSSLVGVIIFYFGEIILKDNLTNPILINSLGAGTLLGIFIGILRSGTPAIKHFILRIILWCSGYIPWNYAKFLNYSTQRLFWQQVGGGYRFIHDLLRQHFANFSPQIITTYSDSLRVRKGFKNILLVFGILVLIGFPSWEFNVRYTSAHAYSNRGSAYSDKKDYSHAIDDYNHAIKLDPNYTKAYYNRGNAYSDKKDYSRAIDDYNHAIKLAPNDADAYTARGLAYYNKKDYSRAIDDYNQAIKLAPNDADAYYNRGLVYDHKKDYSRAIDDYNQAIKLDPNYATAYINRGLAYKNKGSKNKAIKDFKKVLELNNDTELSQEAKQELQNLGSK